MSKFSNFLAVLIADGRRAGGSHLTIEARDRVLRSFAYWCRDRGYQLQATSSIKLKHVKGFIDSFKNKNSDRTIQNKLSAIRTALRGARRFGFSESLKTEEFGVAGASRDGTKRAILRDEFQERIAVAEKLDPGVAHMLRLERALGLRGKESLMADSGVLRRWISEIQCAQMRVTIFKGTKGGRVRTTLPAYPQRTLDILKDALSYCDKNGGTLVRGNLKQAKDRYHNIASAAGFVGAISPHSLRYAYAQDRLSQLSKEGFEAKHALAIVSQDLGHGDGRGRFIKQVYSKSKAGVDVGANATE